MTPTLRTLRADGWMLLASAIWGAAFVAQGAAARHLDALAIIALRFIVGGLMLLPVIAVRRRRVRDRSPLRVVISGGLIAGSVMMVAALLQQRGIEAGSTASAAAFITSLYVLFVPLIGLLGGLRTHPAVWCGTVAATAGLYLLSVNPEFGMARGDVLVLMCAVAWAGHVLAIGRFSPRCDAIELAAAQFLVTGLLAAVIAARTMPALPSGEALRASIGPMLYLGPVAVGVAFTLQVVGQKTAPPAHAAVILSMEGLFGAVFGAMIGGESLSMAQYGGCALMLAGILLAQWPELASRRRVAEPNGRVAQDPALRAPER
jgi:drug/metabolite transporter (DMT)-like permease